MSKIQASQKEYDFNEVDTQIGYDEASRVEKRYTNLGYRAAESLIGLGLVPPGKNFLKVHSQDDTTSPISGLLRPTHKISSETVSVNSPEKVDLMVCKKTDEEKADWFGGKASHITFDALVNATMELDNPYEKQSIVIYPLSKYNISTGENEKTQWDIPEMPVSSNALRVHQELQQLFPEINLPPVKLETYEDSYLKRAFILDLKEFLWENPKIAVGFSRIINLASSAMKGSFGREFLTTEMVRRVLKEEEWKWDRPVMDLPPGDKIEMYTQGLLILVDELNQYLFYTPSRVEADGLTQKTKKQKKIKA
ncbi:MAG: hypothetical protein UR63_C0059G0006 [Candidatus Roizmanbacteria bacterium GW2011_GWC2_35_12]|uniref:Uncharacterized protein n=1 Tax=Candidatus Roizmanbacteria bacterium GW2011_GWC2_35_12 TaxID=1618485 RepID=A0A0G0DQH7_9BACT|nr:MAG: hypothetical protein UR63_C0059G0006 [Candidatus Roizmanbacteria bacterium GW2011_GWC2_35_12]